MRDPSGPAWSHGNGAALGSLEKASPAAYLHVTRVASGSALYGTLAFLFLHFFLLNMDLLFQDTMRKRTLGAYTSEG